MDIGWDFLLSLGSKAKMRIPLCGQGIVWCALATEPKKKVSEFLNSFLKQGMKERQGLKAIIKCKNWIQTSYSIMKHNNHLSFALIS